MKKLIACLLTLGLLIVAACSDSNTNDLFIVSTSVADGTVGATYSQPLLATGGTLPYTWRLDSGALPVGLALSDSGVISGTPTSAGTSTFTATVVDSGSPAQVRSRTFTLTVNQPGVLPLSITTTSPLAGGTVSTAYSQTLTATGGTPAYNWALASGSSLPAGLTLSTAGVISGAPSAAGTSTFTVQVTDSAIPVNSATKQFSLTVAAATSPVTITTASNLPGGTQGTAYSQQLAATGGTSPYSWLLAGGSQLPTGLTLSSGGLLSGSPSVSGTFTFSITATDSATTPNTATKSFSLTLAPAANPLVIQPATLAVATYGVASTPTTLTATGGTPPYTWSLASGSAALPAGMSLSSTGTISGTPSSTGQATNQALVTSITVQVTDSAASPLLAATGLTQTVIWDGTVFYTNNCAGCHEATPALFTPRQGTLANATSNFNTFKNAMGSIATTLLLPAQAPQLNAVLNLLL
ncbi:MAG TPA: putative Ig domain-containing protein [Geomonas sp.]|nr:putative Ig domain-containing protein [Geomonas sp.]